MEELDLSLVVACYNEAPHLEDSVNKILQVLKNTIPRYEIIFVDDASRDGTRDIIRRLSGANEAMAYLFHDANMGRGRAVSDGIGKARGKVAGFIDIDLETDAKYIPALFREIIGGADVACARRIYKITPDSVHRWMLNRGYNFLVRHFLGLRFYDTETGCKFFNRERILPILGEVTDSHWFWDTEIMARAYFRDLKIVEVPTLYVRRRDKKSTVRILPDVLYYLKKLFWFKLEMKKMHTAAVVMAYWKDKSESFSRYYDETKGVKNFFINAFLKKRMSKIFSMVDIGRSARVLDLGCGSGAFIKPLSKMGAEVTGVDSSKSMLSLADARLKSDGVKGYNLVLSEASSVPVADKHFDLVICAGLLDYVNDVGKVLNEIRRVLKDSGSAVITIPSRVTPFFILRSGFGVFLRKALFGLPPILTSTTMSEALKILDEAGFEVKDISQIYFTMFIFLIRRK